jgi:CubicO group peptidase (beta-lactamase class C family)
MTGLTDRIDAYVRDYLADSRVPGLALEVARGGETIHRRGYGVQDVESGEPVTPQTLFHLASVVKTMTGVAILQLRDAGRLDLDDPVVRHLPYFCVDDPRCDQITIRQCLTHTSGIGHPDDWGWERPEFDDESLERHVRGLASHQLVPIAPGQTSYSDIAYNVLGDVIAKISGLTYESYVERRIFQPLGMHDTTTMAPRSSRPELVATGYSMDESGAVERSVYPYNRMYVPCGCIASNVVEMTRYANALLAGGTLDGARILDEASVAETWQVQVPTGNPAPHGEAALGWWVRRPSDELRVEHDGEDDGFQSHLCLWVDRALSIVVLSNGDWDDRRDVTAAVFDLVRDAA